MNNEKSIHRALDLVNNGKHYPAMSLIKTNPETAAVISKLVKSRDPQHFNKSDPNSFYNLDQSRMAQMSDAIKERIGDADNIMQLFPDLELAAQILTSSILSPKDMVNVELIYKTTENILPSDVIMKLMEIVSRECEAQYKIKQSLPEKLREVLFKTGSYVRAIIPESSVDELINGNGTISTEDLKGELITNNEEVLSLGFLGKKGVVEVPGKRIGLESLRYDKLPYQQHNDSNAVATEAKEDEIEKYLDISDNYKLLKMPMIIATNNRAKVKQLLSRNSRHSLEASKVLTGKEFESVVYKGTQGKTSQFLAVKSEANTRRRSVGRPLTMRLPSESVIPVHVPGDEKHHIGYFVLIDEEGNPVSRSTSKNQLESLGGRINDANSSLTSMLLTKARRNLGNAETRNLSIDQAAKLYSDIVESDLIERLRNGVYGSKVAIAKNEDVYRIMLARTYANQFTRLVYIPAELVTYYAYKYYENGVGKSLFDDMKTLISLRGILLFAKVMALTKNSIALTHVNMTLDPQDPDPVKTIEMSIHEITKMRQQYFPLGISSPVDLVDWIQRAGFEFSFEGHPGIPQTKFDFETKQMQYTVPDNDLDELLRKQTIMSFGLSPETVDNGFNAEFATTVVSNNILLSKRVLQIQDEITPHITDEVKKTVTNDYIIRDQMLDVLKQCAGSIQSVLSDEDKQMLENNEEFFYNDLLERFIGVIEVSLPKPDITSLETQSDAYEKYSESLEKAIDAWVNTDFISEQIAGNISGNIDTIKAVLKAYFLRRWMAENGFMNELTDIVSVNEDGNASLDLYNVMKDHIEGITRSSVKFIDSLKAIKTAADKDLETMGVNGDVPISGTDSSTGSDGGDDFGGGDFNFDDLGTGNETTNSETTPTPEPETTEEKTPEETTPTNPDEVPPVE